MVAVWWLCVNYSLFVVRGLLLLFGASCSLVCFCRVLCVAVCRYVCLLFVVCCLSLVLSCSRCVVGSVFSLCLLFAWCLFVCLLFVVRVRCLLFAI